MSTSSPVPLNRVSSPAPPLMVSLPAPPVNMLLPESPVIEVEVVAVALDRSTFSKFMMVSERVVIP